NYALWSESAGGTIRNEGRLAGAFGVTIDADEDASGDELNFVNTGDIESTSVTSNTVNIFLDKVDHIARISNGADGRIRNLAGDARNDSAIALNVRSRARVELDNDGEISAQSRTDGGARIEAMSIDIDNSGTIEG